MLATARQQNSAPIGFRGLESGNQLRRGVQNVVRTLRVCAMRGNLPQVPISDRGIREQNQRKQHCHGDCHVREPPLRQMI